MQIVFFAFGEKMTHYYQISFSILTFLAQKTENDSINVVTDKPALFRHLSESIKIIEIGTNCLAEWKGEFDFFWRVKIKAIECVAEMYKGQTILYLDGDTFLYGDLSQLKTKLEQGNCLMHLNEGNLAKLGTNTEKTMWRQVGGQEFDSIVINEAHCMWNAGVIGIPGNKAKHIINKTLNICDSMLKQNVTRRLIEQFAFSVALSESANMCPAEAHIGHYWGNKEQWDAFITEFFMVNFFNSNDLTESIEAVKSIDFVKIPIRVKIPNTRKRLNKLLSKIYPPKNVLYIQNGSSKIDRT